MNTGQIISGAGHVLLIGWALIGGAFRSEPLPFEVTQVTAISAEDYAALVAAERAPEAVANVDTPEPPETGAAPALSSEADAAPELDQPDPAETAPPDEAPDVTEMTPPAEAEVSDEPPVLEPPQEDVAVLAPEIADTPQPEDAPRVAPEPVAQPEPDVRIDEVAQPEAAPEEAAEPVEEAQDAAQPEAATTEIVTEADELAAAAPKVSKRPKARPAARPEPEPAPEPEETAQPETDDAAVENALAEALGQTGTETAAAPAGPPLTAGEKDALRVAVQQCWNVGSLSTDALNTTVVVAVSMAEDARPVAASIRMLSSSGGSDAAALQAFEAARRAIIRCGANGYNLPKDKYDHWRNIEMTFNPENMRIK